MTCHYESLAFGASEETCGFLGSGTFIPLGCSCEGAVGKGEWKLVAHLLTLHHPEGNERRISGCIPDSTCFPLDPSR